jgi:hypothetical protein
LRAAVLEEIAAGLATGVPPPELTPMAPLFVRVDRRLAALAENAQPSGPRPLTFWASATSTSQPHRSSVSCTNRTPFIDSIAARTATGA